MLNRWLLVVSLILISPILTFAQARIQGFAERGGKTISTSPSSSYKVQESYPGATVTVYETGTTTLAAIYTSSALTTPKSNPFTADSGAYYYFYTDDNVKVDIRFSGTGITTPFTIPEVNGIPAASGGGGGSGASSYYCDSTKGCFDPNAAPYNCVVDNSSLDSTSCIQSVLDAAAAWSVANGGKTATVPFDLGAYYIKSDVSTTGGYRAQIRLPTSNYLNPGSVIVTSKADGIFSIGHFNANANALVLFVSTLTGKSYINGVGWPSVFGTKDPHTCSGATSFTGPCAIAEQNWIAYYFKSVCGRQQTNPSLATFNFSLLNRVIIEDSRVDVIPAAYTLPATYTVATNPTGVGVIMPINNADAGIYRGWFEIAGYYGCMGISETTSLTGHIQNMYCKVGEFIQAPYHHMPYIMGDIYDVRNEIGIGYIHPTTGVTSFPVGLLHTYLTHVRINSISFENDASPPYYANRTYHINDPTNSLRLEGHYNVVKGNVGGFGLPVLKNGGRNVDFDKFTNQFAPDLPKQAVILDTFTGADATLITARKPDQDKPNVSWTNVGATGTFSISGNRAIGSTAADNFSVINSGISDFTIKATGYFTGGGGSQAIGVVFNYTNSSNFWYCEWQQSPNNFKIVKVVAGLPSTLGNFSLPAGYFTATDFEEHTIRVNRTGNNIQIILDYAVMYNDVDSFNATATIHGIHTYGTSGAIESFEIIR